MTMLPVRNPFRQAAIRRIPSFHHEHPSYRWWVLANIMLSSFLSVLMSTIVNGALPSMMNSLGVNLDTIQWVLTSYLLVFAIMLPLSAWLAERFGFKLTYLTALSVFTLGSFLCFVSWDISTLIVSRIIQGAGGGIIIPLGMALVTREFPPKQRGIAMGLWAIASAASMSFGPSIGGYLIDNFGWRSTFLFTVPIGALAVLSTLIIQRELDHSRSKPFDFLGFITVSIFILSLLLALTDGNAAWNTEGWTSPFIIGCLTVSAAALGLFLFVELKTAHPLVDLRLLKQETFCLSNAIMFLIYLGLLGSTFLLPLYFQNVLGYSALQSGLMFLPLGIMQAVLSPLSGIMGNRWGPKVPAILGILLLAASLFLNAFLDSVPAPWLITLPIVLRGAAYGLIFTPLQVIAVSRLSPHQLAQGSSLLNLIRQVGGSFGVAIFGLLLTQRNAFHSAISGEGLVQYGGAYDQSIRDLSYSLVQNAGVPLSDSRKIAGMLISQNLKQTAYIQAICDVFFIVALISLVCVIPLLFLKDSGPLYRKKA